MSEQTTKAKISSWAVPTPEDDALWEGMTRDEQLAAMQEHFNSPNCSTSTDLTVADVVERARAARKERQASNGDRNL